MLKIIICSELSYKNNFCILYLFCLKPRQIALLKNETCKLDCYADWCGPCRIVSPLVDEIADENPQYIVGKINVDNEPELTQAFGVMSIPMLAVMKDGKVVNQAVGARPKDSILEMLEG